MKKYTVPTPYPVGPVHIYEFGLNGKTVLFDTGPGTREAKAYVQENLALEKLDYLFITHFHPDHYGLIPFFEENSNVEVIVSGYDALLYEHHEDRARFLHDFFVSLGFSPEAMERLRNTLYPENKPRTFAKKYRILEESGELLQSLGIDYISCPGHSQSDIICLVDNYAVSADVALRDIFQTPLLDYNIHTLHGRFCNYRAYCETIPRLKSIEKREFLPGHRDYINSVDEQILFYVGKMLQRGKVLFSQIQPDQNVFDILLLLFPNALSMDPFFMYIKTSEILFMQDFLTNPQILIEALQSAGLYSNLQHEIEELFSV